MEHEAKIKDNLTGKQFGKLTVLSRADDYVQKRGSHEAMWNCICSCDKHKKIVVRDYLLRTGQTKSCGCLRGQWCIKTNEYSLGLEYGVGYTSNNEEFFFDIDDYDKIKEYCWKKASDGYIVTRIRTTGKLLKMQWLVTDNIDIDHRKIVVDHINGIKHDNRKNNLRVVTRSQNNMNRSISSNNKSGCTGVFWLENRNKWWAYIGINHKNINLGYYSNYEDAVKARKNAEEKYFGEYSYDNSRRLDGEDYWENLD